MSSRAIRNLSLSCAAALVGSSLYACTSDESASGGNDAGNVTLDGSLPDTATGDAPHADTSSTNDSSANDTGATDGGPDTAVDASDAPSCVGLHFTGATDQVLVPSATGLNYGAATTLELWLYADNTADAGPPLAGTLFCKWENFVEDKFYSLNSAGAPFVYIHGSPVQSITATTPVTTGHWTHFAVVHDGTSSRIYLNGQMVKELAGSATIANGAGPLQIGHVSRDYETTPVVGFYSEMRLSKVARYTAAAFTPATHLASDTDTVAFWKFDEGTGTTAADSSGNGFNGSISGATWSAMPCR